MSTEQLPVETAILQRETILPSSDRGRLAAIIATCSMAGLAGGMALSMLAESQRVADELRRDQLAASMRLDEEQAYRAGPTTWLGVKLQDVGGKCGGVRVTKVERGSPADRVGFHAGDIVETFGGDAICDGDTLVDVVRGSVIGATPSMTIKRGAQHLTLHPTLAVMPAEHRR